jgi:hypothetical protein
MLSRNSIELTFLEIIISALALNTRRTNYSMNFIRFLKKCEHFFFFISVFFFHRWICLWKNKYLRMFSFVVCCSFSLFFFSAFFFVFFFNFPKLKLLIIRYDYYYSYYSYSYDYDYYSHFYHDIIIINSTYSILSFIIFIIIIIDFFNTFMIRGLIKNIIFLRPLNLILTLSPFY